MKSDPHPNINRRNALRSQIRPDECPAMAQDSHDGASMPTPPSASNVRSGSQQRRAFDLVERAIDQYLPPCP
ncbi:MAG TPA: hypothetical protein VHM21_06855, partial [Sphingomicrobium sp.]|nr:hypothetical protein [Sphingomicrobium sp.]